MISHNLSINLPIPWRDKKFATTQLGLINFLVGPNGSGKSKFAATLKSTLGKARLLGTDRLSGMEPPSSFRNTFGDHFSGGLAKSHFQIFKNAGDEGFGIDTVVLLEERLELRIQVEATLSHLFDRKIMLEWDSGNLIPRAMLGANGSSYRLDREECHGIKELLILLTHLYNEDYPYLIIDEPELNLHPQYQAFFMQEVRKLAGDPAKDSKKKVIFLITHSPFILDFRSIEDVKSVISFSQDHSIPRQILSLDVAATARLSSLVPRLNVHHKQLFFSDNPIFVEGILDAQIVATMQEARGVSIAGAGSCIIDAGGNEEVNKYLELCLAFGKHAHFLYDLDSLFGGNLRACLKGDGSIQSFLATAGVGNDLSKYCGEMDSRLTKLIDQVVASTTIPAPLIRLAEFLKSLGPRTNWDGKRWAKARVSVLTAMNRYPSAFVAATSPADVADIQGRLKQIVGALGAKNINLLPGGTLERYLPSYAGDAYELTDDAKRDAVAAEIEEMAKGLTEDQMSSRYGELFTAVTNLPSKVNVDVETVLRDYLSRYIHDLQVAIAGHPAWHLPQLQGHLSNVQKASARVFALQEFTRGPHKEFSAVISIVEMLGQKKRVVRVNHKTNAGMGDFKIEYS
jgi:hypothetical protein